MYYLENENAPVACKVKHQINTRHRIFQCKFKLNLKTLKASHCNYANSNQRWKISCFVKPPILKENYGINICISCSTGILFVDSEV